MANPFYKSNNGGGSFIQQFPRFMQQMRGKNPTEILNNLISSGKVSQQQLDAAQQQAQQMSGMFEQFKRLFGR